MEQKAPYKHILARRPPPPTHGMGSNGQNSTVSEYGHVANQIKLNAAGSNMLASILHVDPLALGEGSKGQNPNFSDNCHVAYQIK